jgi:hypothetical protein
LCSNCVNNYFNYDMKNQNYPKKNIPRLIQRANDIVVAYNRDRCELTKEGLSWELVVELAEMAPIVSDIDVQYRLQKETITLLSQTQREYECGCFMLRSELWHAINQAFLLCKLNYRLHGVSQKKSRVSLAQDLNDLSYLSTIFREQFETVHFNFALSENAAHVARELDEKVAALQIERDVLRCVDQPRRYASIIDLFEKMNTICHYGRRVFKRDPSRRLAYRKIT